MVWALPLTAPTRGHWAVSGHVLMVTAGGGVLLASSGLGARDVADPPTVHRAAPAIENIWAEMSIGWKHSLNYLEGNGF